MTYPCDIMIPLAIATDEKRSERKGNVLYM